MRAMIVMVALVLTGCAHASGVRYTFTPCNPSFQDAVMACFYEAGIGGPVVGYDFYADSHVSTRLPAARRHDDVASQGAIQRRYGMAVAQ